MSAMAFHQMTGHQAGGLINPFEVIYQHLDRPLNLLYGSLLLILIIFIEQVPMNFRILADKLLGRMIGILVIVLTTMSIGWVYGLLATIAFLLLIHIVPKSKEGFHVVQGKDVERPNSRWFVERVLGERPVRIETDTVGTEPIQDLSEHSMSRGGR